MQKIKFITADRTECQGYLFTWEGLSFGLTKDHAIPSNGWSVFELQTGCSVVGKQLSTRKEAIKEALELLDSKGLRTVKKRIKEIFVERGSTKAGSKIKIAHSISPENRLKTLCGRANSMYSLPLEYFNYAKRPCKKCQRLAKKGKLCW